MIGTRTCRRGSPIGSHQLFRYVGVRSFSERGVCYRQQDVSSINDHSESSQNDGDSDKVRFARSKDYRARKTVFSGIQPTGIPHLGNYLGALRQWKEFQDDTQHPQNPINYRLIYCIVDLHALTHSQSPALLLQHRMETLASLLAIGLDPKQSEIYFQSSIEGHSQLMWYLSNVASTGYLSRMTQWKSKLGVSDDATLEDQAAREKLRLGLFSYPVLQAADILLFGANLVPVGEDQKQHVEFARRLAKSFNAQYREANGGADFFPLPKAVISPAKRIMSLKDPNVKMSKSHKDENSRILITDSPDEIRNKVKVALTDSIQGISYDINARPGVSNLVQILKYVSNNTASCEEIANDHAEQSMRAFKEHVAEEIVKSLSGIRDRYFELRRQGDQKMLDLLNTRPRYVFSAAGSKIGALHTLMGLRAPTASQLSQRQVAASNKKKVLREQEEEEARGETEPDVVPQQKEGVDLPIAS